MTSEDGDWECPVQGTSKASSATPGPAQGGQPPRLTQALRKVGKLSCSILIRPGLSIMSSGLTYVWNRSIMPITASSACVWLIVALEGAAGEKDGTLVTLAH